MSAKEILHLGESDLRFLDFLSYSFSQGRTCRMGEEGQATRVGEIGHTCGGDKLHDEGDNHTCESSKNNHMCESIRCIYCRSYDMCGPYNCTG
jgi:hypothetical protein